jgi:DNA-binding NarL/FixJ family response regulator
MEMEKIRPGIKNATSQIRTLIVDDSIPFRLHLHAFAGSLGCLKVIGRAGNGIEALNLIGRHNPQLVLMDLEMPGMDGLQATQLIRDFHPETRVIIIAVHESTELEAACLAQGADAFIPKSRMHRNLKRVVNRLFSGQAADPLAQVTAIY